MKVLGIDEAGRGPIIGPMVMAGVVISPEDEEKLVNMGVKDSKQLSPKKREELFDRIKDYYKHKIVVISPEEIDKALDSPTLNLNWLEGLKTADIINEIKPDKAILDAPSNNIRSYVQFVTKHLELHPEIVAEHKADETYPVVSAASILAKVTRDRIIKDIEREVGIPIGSGYPSDPVTQEFVKKYYKTYGKYMRKSWATYKDLFNSQKSLGEF